MNSEFWNNRKVLITGHTGFKGSWLAMWLLKNGARVAGYALPPLDVPNLFESAGVEKNMHSVMGDIRNHDLLMSEVTSYKPEVIIHMAAQPLVRYSYKHPVETYSTNVMGTVNILEAARAADSVRVVVNITSDKCYENNEWHWGYRENEPMGGYDPYSSSKGCAELVTSAYRKSYFNPVSYEDHGVALASARAGNVIGGGDWSEDRLVPDIMRAFIDNRKVVIRNPNAIRPWQHVLEPLSGYIRLAEKLWGKGSEYAEGWNFGPRDEDARPVAWIVDYMSKVWGDGASWELDTNDHPHEASYLKLDCSKAKNLLDWEPALSLSSALEWTVDYYRGHKEGADLNKVVVDQITRYEGMQK